MFRHIGLRHIECIDDHRTRAVVEPGFEAGIERNNGKSSHEYGRHDGYSTE